MVTSQLKYAGPLMENSISYLSLGSNLGDRRQNLRFAIELFENDSQWWFNKIKVKKVSEVFETSPIGGPAGQPNYFNIAIATVTSLIPLELLEVCHEIEKQAGRTRTIRWEARILDIDILIYGEIEQTNDVLTIPHPRMWERRFVLEPLRQIAPELVSKANLSCLFAQKVHKVGML